MTSDARNSQIPSLPLVSPVSGRSSTVYGIFIDYALSGSNCGVKSFAAPGTLYSYGPRYTIGSVRKLPGPGGEGADHSRVVASHGFLSTTAPHLMLVKKLMMNGIWNNPIAHAATPMTRFSFTGVIPWPRMFANTTLLCAYCAPPSYIRRFIQARPCANMGMNTMLMQMNVPQK